MSMNSEKCLLKQDEDWPIEDCPVKDCYVEEIMGLVLDPEDCALRALERKEYRKNIGGREPLPKASDLDY